jgi:anaerobic C4-dicarboxylate transporter DcuB
MMPGLICVTVSTIIGYLITNVAFHNYFASFIQ